MIDRPELNIKHIRELKNYTQEYVAEQLGITTRAYSKIETGETQLTINRLNEIGAILNVDPIEILGFNEKNIFNINNSSGNNGLNYISHSDKLIEQYEQTIQSLKDQAEALKQQIELLKLLLEK